MKGIARGQRAKPRYKLNSLKFTFNWYEIVQNCMKYKIHFHKVTKKCPQLNETGKYLVKNTNFEVIGYAQGVLIYA